MGSQEIAGKVYTAAFQHYQDKMERNAATALPVIKNVYEDSANNFERIVVPFTDGAKSLNVVTNLKEAYESNGKQLVNDFEKNITLAIVDDSWKTHLRKMDELKQSVQLAVHEQKDPLLIYKFEAFELFKLNSAAFTLCLEPSKFARVDCKLALAVSTAVAVLSKSA